MNEKENPQLYSTPQAAPPPAAPAPPAPPRTWRDIVCPLAALVLAGLYWSVFAVDTIACAYGPGLGVLVFVLAYWAVVFVTLGPRWHAGGLCFIAVTVCLALCCTLYAHMGFMVLNCFLILMTAAIGTFALSGQLGAGVLEARALPKTFLLSILALFSRIAPPLRRLFPRRERGAKRDTRRVWLAVLVSIGLLAVVLALLASADRVFGSFFEGFGRWIETLDPFYTVWRVTRLVTLAVFFCSALYYIRLEPPRPVREAAERPRPVLPFLLPSVLLDIVYVLFCAVQLRFLFGGAESAAMAGGWAEYARTGFFQLVVVAAINLTLCALATNKARLAQKGGLALRIAEGLMLALTLVILASAARRMQLYILAYGMSVLRLVTLWGMLVIAVGILASAWKLCRPDFRFFPVLFGFALASWCLLCLFNPAGRVADYNVDAYLDGRLAEVDTEYLTALTPDADRAIDRLCERSAEYRAECKREKADRDRFREEDTEGTWATWKASAQN